MTRFALPAGRWRYLLPAALVVTSLSAHLLSALVAMFEAFGTAIPTHARVAATPSWVPAWIALAMLGVAAAAVRQRSGAVVLASTTAFLLGAAAFTLWSALALWSTPVCLLGDFPFR